MKNMRVHKLAVLIFGIAVFYGITAFGALPGNIDGFEDTNLKDAVLALQITGGMTTYGNIEIQADVDGNGLIGIEEAVYALQVAAGIRIQTLFAVSKIDNIYQLENLEISLLNSATLSTRLVTLLLEENENKVTLTREADNDTTDTWTGKIEGDESSSVVLTAESGDLSGGCIRTGEKFYFIQKDGDNYTVSVTQNPDSCTYYSISPDNISFESVGGEGTIRVRTCCEWTAVSNDTNWITITSGASGIGSGTISYSVAENTGPLRIGKITVAGYEVSFEQKPFTNSLGMAFVQIPAGTFLMGSPTAELGRDNDEIQHQVTLSSAFYMQTTEVTQGQWEAVMGSNPSYFQNCGGNCPVEYVTWNDVQSFITEMNKRGEGTYRLPTEAEWEYSARAGSTTAIVNGDIAYTIYTKCSADTKLNAIGWYCGNSAVTYSGCYNASSSGGPSCAGSHPVAQKQANAWGLHDMSGNVWEWCQDWYGTYPSTAVTDPPGPSTGSFRIIRDGSWSDGARLCRSASRYLIMPSFKHIDLGFRLVVSW